MPNPHFRVTNISRAEGRNAVASVAYRAGENLNEQKTVAPAGPPRGSPEISSLLCHAN
jgi:hypothetical protein